MLKPENFDRLIIGAEFSALSFKGWHRFRLRGKVEAQRSPRPGLAVRVISKHAKKERWLYLEDFVGIDKGWMAAPKASA